MKVTAIIKKALIYLDEVGAMSDATFVGSMPLEDVIMSLIPECALFYTTGKPMADEVLSSLYVNSSGVGFMDVPSDYGRLQELRLSCWHRSVYEAIGIDSAQYSRQHNLVTRGGLNRPVVAKVPDGDVYKFELYSVPLWDSRVKVERAFYVPRVEIGNEDVDIPIEAGKESLLCYMIAVRVARIHGNEKAAALLSASLQEQMAVTRLL